MMIVQALFGAVLAVSLVPGDPLADAAPSPGITAALDALAVQLRPLVPPGKALRETMTSNSRDKEPDMVTVTTFDPATRTLIMEQTSKTWPLAEGPDSPQATKLTQFAYHAPDLSLGWFDNGHGAPPSRFYGGWNVESIHLYARVDALPQFATLRRKQEEALARAEQSGDAPAADAARAELKRLDWHTWNGQPQTFELTGKGKSLERQPDGTYREVEKELPQGRMTLEASPEGLLLAWKTELAASRTRECRLEIIDAPTAEMERVRSQALAVARLHQPRRPPPTAADRERMERSFLQSLQAGSGRKPLGVEMTKDGELVRIRRVMPGGLAEGKIRVGDVIVAINGEPVKDRSLREVAEAIRMAPSLVLEVLHEGQSTPETLTLRTE